MNGDRLQPRLKHRHGSNGIPLDKIWTKIFSKFLINFISLDKHRLIKAGELSITLTMNIELIRAKTDSAEVLIGS